MSTKRTFAVLALVAAASMALTAASASAAAPEFGRCVKVAAGTGVYATANCTTEGGEKKYAWTGGPPPKPGFTIASTSTLLFEAKTANRMVCQSAAGTGEVTGTATTGNVTIALKGCESGALACSTAGAAKGEVVLAGYTGSLGVIKAGETALKDKVGLSLAGSTTPECGEGLLRITISGAPIGTIAPTDAMALKRIWKFTEKSGHQNPEHFEGGPPATLTFSVNGIEEGPAGLSAPLTLTSAEKVEINTVV